MPRQKLNWSLERSRILADRDARPSLALKWERDTSFNAIRYVGYDADGHPKGSVDLLGSVFVSRAVLPTLEIARVAEFSARSGCVALRQAQAAVEAHFANLAAPVREAA